MALVACGLAAGWAVTLIDTPVNNQDPAAVATQFIQELQAGRSNHAYHLTSTKYQKAITYDVFVGNVIPSISDNWPASPAKQYGIANPPDGDKNTVQILFSLAADQDTPAYKAAILLVRSKAGQPWYVEGITSIPASEDNEKPAQQPSH